MSLAQSLLSYMTLNVLIGFGFIIIGISFYVCQKLQVELSSKVKLQIHYWLLSVILTITILHPVIPKSDFFQPTAKVWSAVSVKSFYTQYSDPSEAGYMSFSVTGNQLTWKSQDITYAWMLLCFVVFVCGVSVLVKDLILLLRIKNNSYLFKKIGRVSIGLNDHIQIPFSYSALRANVIIPTAMLSNRIDFKMALSHELQHHRQKDTVWIYILWLLKIVCVANPFVYLWVREISEIQEFACDEALIGRKKVESQSYARCLVEVAQTAMNQKRKLVCATGLTFLLDRNLLKRRIEKMFHKQFNTKKSVKIALIVALSSILSVTAYAATGLVQDRRVSMKEAQVMVQNAKVNSSFPIEVNDLVLIELNRYLGTPEGRDFIRQSLVRMESYRSLLNRKLQEYHMPEELMAIPIIESSYQNLPQSENKSWGAGLWMFIESTARNYGLRVEASVDDRLNPEILTDAAMRYISANYARFKDYQLALLSYNIGEGKVQEGINKIGSRDAWVLTRNGYHGEKYLARLMAAILIMKNPKSVQ